MERICFSFAIRAGTFADYKKRHDEIWPELVADLKKAGFANYSLYRYGEERIIAYVECEPDAESCFGALSHSEANARWSKWFEEIIVSLTDDEGNVYALEEVWHLD